MAENDGVVTGRIEQILRKGADPAATCTECSDDRKGQPLKGLEIIRGAKKAEGKDVWEGGKILDPENGKTYTLRLTPIEGGAKLEVRGSIGLWPHPDLGARAVNHSGRRPQRPPSSHLWNIHVPIQCEESRRARRWRDGCADRGPSGQCQGARGAVRPACQGRPESGIAERAIANLKKLKPSPIGVAEDADLIQPANYEEHLKLLKGCDLIIEAIAERMDWKLDLYTKIAPHVAKHAIVASNTSGLSITKLSGRCPTRSSRAFAASTSSTRRATCRWWS